MEGKDLIFDKYFLLDMREIYLYQLSGDDLKLTFTVKERAKLEGKSEREILDELGIPKALKPSQRWPKVKSPKKQKTSKRKSYSKVAPKPGKSSRKGTSQKSSSNDSVNQLYS